MHFFSGFVTFVFFVVNSNSSVLRCFRRDENELFLNAPKPFFDPENMVSFSPELARFREIDSLTGQSGATQNSPRRTRRARREKRFFSGFVTFVFFVVNPGLHDLQLHSHLLMVNCLREWRNERKRMTRNGKIARCPRPSAWNSINACSMASRANHGAIGSTARLNSKPEKKKKERT